MKTEHAANHVGEMNGVSQKGGVRAAFEFDGVTIPLSTIKPIRQVKSADGAFGKYRAILASIREVGVIEPLIVFPEKGATGSYFLLDGHLRLKALQELGQTAAACLIAREADVLTYNSKVNGLSAIQEHAMICRALDLGVTPEQIASALDLDVNAVRAKMNLLDGIEPEAVRLLKDRSIPASALRLFRRVRPARQIDMAQLMLASENYTTSYAAALILGTPADQLLGAKHGPLVKGLSSNEIERMEKEMESLECELRGTQDSFGENALHLSAAQRYVKRLLENPRVKKFLATHYPELWEGFESLLVLESI
jgi:hypothetical protein